MAEPPRRNRFQFHLSTAIVLMFVAGGLMWANTLERSEKTGFQPDGSPGDDFDLHLHKRWGWPLTAVHRRTSIHLIAIEHNRHVERLGDGWNTEILWQNLGFDLFCLIAILIPPWFLCEWQIRRRAGRKGA
jgi:hypothetical protein